MVTGGVSLCGPVYKGRTRIADASESSYGMPYIAGRPGGSFVPHAASAMMDRRRCPDEDTFLACIDAFRWVSIRFVAPLLQRPVILVAGWGSDSGGVSMNILSFDIRPWVFRERIYSRMPPSPQYSDSDGAHGHWH